MGAYAEANVERFGKRELDRGADRLDRLAAHAKKHGDGFATLFDTKSLWRRDVQFNIVGGRAFGRPVLQRGQSRTVLGGVSVDTVGIERLAEHQECR